MAHRLPALSKVQLVMPVALSTATSTFCLYQACSRALPLCAAM